MAREGGMSVYRVGDPQTRDGVAKRVSLRMASLSIFVQVTEKYRR